MKFFTLLFLLISLNVGAQEACEEAVPAPFEELFELQRKLHWHAASDQEVRNAKCLRTKNFTEDEMKNWMKENDGRKINSTINGISFEDESEENLKAFKHLTTAVNFFGRPDPERQKKFSSSCKKVQCAMEEIFGKKTATHLLFMHRKFGMNGSHLAYENADSWKKEELDLLLLALSDFPEGILPVRENKQMIRFKRGYMRNGGERTIANAVMEFFDPFDRQSTWQKRTTVTHELAHVIAAESKVDDSSEWAKLGGWEETTKVTNGKKTTNTSSDRQAVSMYGEANQHEDFAEAVVAYRYNPQLLKSVSPKKYELIKTVIFDNVEYTSQKACQNPKRLSDEVRAKATEMANQWEPTEKDLQAVAKSCSELAIKRLADGNIDLSQGDFQYCYEKSLSKYMQKFALQSVENHPYNDFIGPLFRNSKPLDIDSEKVKQLTKLAQNTHRSLLRKEVAKALEEGSKYVRNNCSEGLFPYAYQSVDEDLLGINSYSHKNEFEKLTRRSCEQMNQKRSYLRRTAGTKFTEEEIQNQVKSIIK